MEIASLEPVTRQWIAEANVRRTVVLGSILALLTVAGLLGLKVSPWAYVALMTWITIGLLLSPWAVRGHPPKRRQARYLATLAIDLVAMTVVYWLAHGAEWLGALPFFYSALIANSTLPTRWARPFTGLVLLAWGLTLVLGWLGLMPGPSPFGMPGLEGKGMMLLMTFVAAVLTIVTALVVQGRLVGLIRESEQRYEQLVREAPDMIITFDLQGRFVEVNPATQQQSGYSFTELKALPNAEFFPPEDLATLISARDRIAGGDALTVTIRYIRKDRTVRWAACRTTPIVRNGVPQGILVIARDVTDEIVRTQALRASEERFRSLVSAFDRAFFVLDPDGRFAGLFGRWTQIEGITPADFLGRTPRDLIGEAAAQVHEEAFARALRGEDVAYEWTYLRPGTAEPRHLRISVSPMRDGDGRTIGIAGVAADVTRRVNAEAEAVALRKRVAEAERIEALGKLVSGVAHELNNPLASILNFTENLLIEAEDEEQRSSLEIIQSQALRSRTIVRDLLTFVRRGDDRPRTVQRPGPILETLVRALRPGVQVQGVTLHATLGSAEIPLQLDRAGFEQVVTNLIVNAAQAAGARGNVWVESRREDDFFVVQVDDDGPGIGAEHLPRLFEPFFTTKPTGQGVGLGLSVSLGIVQQHGGTLSAGSRAGGTGASFCLRLPVAKDEIVAEAPVRAAGPPVAPPKRSSAPSLLIIDDEEPIRRALRKYFERQGWTVREANDGLVALGLFNEPGAIELYDVILCDLKMPGMSGPELYAELQQRAPALLDRIIIATGDVTASEAAAFLSGVKGPVLEKPFELEQVGELADRVRSGRGGEAPG